MKYSIPPFIEEFAHRVSKIPYAKLILKPFYYPIKDIIQQKRNKQFRKYSIDVVSKFCKCMEDNNIWYTMAFGSLLGTVRDGGFIKHDLDVDVIMWADDYNSDLSSLLAAYGFRKTHTFLTDGGRLGREETYEFNNVSIDIFYLYKPIDQLPYCCDYSPMTGCSTWRESMKKNGNLLTRRLELPYELNKKRKIAQFESIQVYIPSNAEDILSARYGDDYMIPNPHWSNVPNEHVIVWTDVKSVFIE